MAVEASRMDSVGQMASYHSTGKPESHSGKTNGQRENIPMARSKNEDNCRGGQ